MKDKFVELVYLVMFIILLMIIFAIFDDLPGF